MRWGVIGGTFDPVHTGHLIIAQEVGSRLRLDKVVFVPAGVPPHKVDYRVTPGHHRLRMVEIAVSDNPLFSISTVDLEREGPSYTTDTVQLLLDKWGLHTEIFFVVGTDSLSELLTWRNPERLLELCSLAVVARPGYSFDRRRLLPALPRILERTVMVPSPRIDISSTDVRHRVGHGLPIRYLVPHDVDDYITRHGIYRSMPARMQEDTVPRACPAS
jgi:nicotinate-nucleotide adenylyltransferase